MSRVLNPTGYAAQGICDGQDYEFPPFSIVDIWNEVHADHITERNAKQYGLISLEPTSAQRAQYGNDRVAFFKAQTIQGIKNFIKSMTDAFTYEKQAEMEAKDKAGCEADRKAMKSPFFEKRMKEAEKWLADVESDKWSPKKYLENQTRSTGNEPWDYTA